MKDIFKVAAILLGGFTIGSITQSLFDRQKVDATVNYNNELVAENDGLRKKNMELLRDLEICKVTNHQVATYACNLKKQLDNYEDF